MEKKFLHLELYQANIELQLRINQLLQVRTDIGLNQLSLEGSNNPSTVLSEKLDQPINWITTALPPALLLRLLQHRPLDQEILDQIATKNQIIFIEELRQALKAWREQLKKALEGTDVDHSVLDWFDE